MKATFAVVARFSSTLVVELPNVGILVFHSSIFRSLLISFPSLYIVNLKELNVLI
jgi:hypothetical protein